MGADSPNLVEKSLQKCPSGIRGLDDVTGGGLPRGRTSLVCGGAGCGKTTLATEFLVRGAVEYGEPGVFFSFEEKAQELVENFASMGFDLESLQEEGKLLMEHVYVERSEIEETGEYDLEALFIRLNYAIDTIGAKRVVLDTIEVLFAALPNEGILRAELRRLFRWLNEKGVTAIVTGEKGEKTLTRHGLEEYVADCVIFLDHRVTEQLSTRRLRIVKYRGSAHGTDEYPFLISKRGVSVIPLTSVALAHSVSNERVSTGIARLDAMLSGGPYRGSTVLISGTAGTGKTSISSHFAEAACRRGERVLYMAFEEPPMQIIRNMKSIGLDLAPCVEAGLLRFHAQRATTLGMESHLLALHEMVDEFEPSLVVFDPVTNFATQGSRLEVKSLVTRLADFLRAKEITSVFVTLTSGEHKAIEDTDIDISSLIDTWFFLRDLEVKGERNRVIYVLKSRGMAHSNQLREFLITSKGVELLDAYLGQNEVLTGSARLAQEAAEQAEASIRRERLEAMRRDLGRKEEALEAHLTALRDSHQAEMDDLRLRIAQEELRERTFQAGRDRMALRRQAAEEGDGHGHGRGTTPDAD